MPLPSTFLNNMDEDESVNPKHPENVHNMEEKVRSQDLLYNQNDLVKCCPIKYHHSHYVTLCNSL